MSWCYNQANGSLSKDGALVTDAGWSGHDAGRNNSAMEADADIGPIPRGAYYIQPAIDSEKLGPVALRLIPNDATNTYGRTGFFIHGASVLDPEESSHGCIILPRPVRIAINASQDKDLEVV